MDRRTLITLSGMREQTRRLAAWDRLIESMVQALQQCLSADARQRHRVASLEEELEQAYQTWDDLQESVFALETATSHQMLNATKNRSELAAAQAAAASREADAASVNRVLVDRVQALETAMARELAGSAALREQLAHVRDDSRQDRAHDGRKLQRREHQVELAAAHVSASKVRLRLCAESRDFFETLMNENPPAEQRHLRLLIENQLSTLRNKSGRCVWYREVLQWCTDVYRAKPAAYEHMAKGGFLKLPDADTVRKRAAQVQASAGKSMELLKRLKNRIKDLPPQKREMALLFDEINIVGDIAFKVIHNDSNLEPETFS
jgi:hypothetical protein